MLGIQEIFTKDIIKETLPQVKSAMESSKDKGIFDYYENNIYGTGIRQGNPLNKSKAAQLRETIENLSLQQLCEKAGYVREFIAKSGTTGIQGAAYLIPDKIYQILTMSAVEEDVCAQISVAMLGPDQIPGSSVKIDVEQDESYKPYKFSSGGSQPEMEFTTVQATLTPISWGINFNIGNDLIEDSQFDIVTLHLEQAGREMGEFASNEALTILGTAPDGDGTLNSGASGDADETKFQGATTDDIKDAVDKIIKNAFTPNKIVTSRAAMMHSILTTVGLAYQESLAWDAFARDGFPTRMAGCDIIYTNCDYITNSKVFTNLITLTFDNRYALITGRKRWMRIEKYSEPVMDLSGAVVSARQDSVTQYKDSIHTLTET